MSQALPRHQRPTRLKKFLFGVPYYPEHWTAQERDTDPQRMAEAGVNVVRMAEFAWDRMEPAPGKLGFSLFDETIARLAAVGIDTILCTPTATPPAWLTAGRDHWFRVDAAGKRMYHGSRQHVCTNNEEFRAESRRITAAMAEHFSPNEHVIGWQTDNELYCHMSECYCDSCQAGFRAWLSQRYGTIAALNEAWGTAFWALTYDDFDQIRLPDPNPRPANANPAAELDYYRYISDSVIEFQKQQVKILRAAQPRWWVTHNGLFGHIDYWKFAADLDFLAVDVYPGFTKTRDPVELFWASYINQRCRASSGGYVVPEQEAGAGGSKRGIHRTPGPGQMRLWAYQSIANGADGVLHFRWRTCRFGAEEYWRGVLDHDNVPRRRYAELAQEGAELKRLGPKILHTVQDVRAAVLIETEQTDAHRTMSLTLPSPEDQGRIALRQMWLRHLPCGLVQTADSFDGLTLLWLPSMRLMDEALAARLEQFVAAGGTLVVTAHSGTRDRNNQVIALTPPGLLAKMCGITMEEFSREDAEWPVHMKVAGTDDNRIICGGGYEMLALHGAEALATWTAPREFGPCAAEGQPAISLNRFGKGQVVYVGTFLSDANAGEIMDLVLDQAQIPPLADCAGGVEVTRRHAPGRHLTFVLNHHTTPQTIRRLPAGAELISSRPCTGEWMLEPYGVAIIEEK